MSAHPLPRRIGLTAAALAMAAAAAGCGASHSNATPNQPGSSGLATAQSPTGGRPAGTAYGESFLAIVSPVNQDLAQLQAALPSLGKAPTGTRLTQAVTPTVAELQQADDTLSQIDWPPAAEDDIHAYLGSDGALSADLQTLEQAGPGKISAAEARVMQDLQARDTTGQALRADIGVPG